MQPQKLSGIFELFAHGRNLRCVQACILLSFRRFVQVSSIRSLLEDAQDGIDPTKCIPHVMCLVVLEDVQDLELGQQLGTQSVKEAITSAGQCDIIKLHVWKSPIKILLNVLECLPEGHLPLGGAGDRR